MNKEHEAKENRLSPKLLAGIILALFFGIALCLRVYLPYDQVFSGEWIKFTGIDAYYHMHLVDNLAHNFPHSISFDPYFIFPGGGKVTISFFGWLLAAIIWVIGLGSPTQHTIDVVGVYFPAILGALTVIPIYFIGKELFGRWAGVLSAGLIALLPGEFLGRSILGFTDHHVAEVLFSTVAILFLILAIKVARQRQLTFKHLRRRHWAISTKPLIYSLLAGISLGIYLITWGAGGLLFVFIICVYLIIQFIIDHLKQISTDYLCLIGVIPFFIATIMFVPTCHYLTPRASIIIALFFPLVLSGVSRLMASKAIKPAYYPLTLVGIGLVGLAIFYAIYPYLLGKMLGLFHVFVPTGAKLTTIEMQPFLFPGGNFSIQIAWGNFTTGFFLGLVSLGILIYLVIKHGSAEKSLLVVWSLVILAATLGQRRFAYYFAVNVSILTAYLSWQFLSLAGFKELVAKRVEISERLEQGRTKTKLKKRQKAGFRITTRHVNMTLAIIIVFFLVFFPNIGPLPHDSIVQWLDSGHWMRQSRPNYSLTITTASQARFAPNDAWMSSLSWLKENTPDPFGDPDFYYKLYESPPPGESYNYPESAYGIMAWWDYGYWIIRIAHRVPNANPGQPPIPLTNTARFFLSQDEDSANEIIQEMGSSYIIIDYPTTIGKFYAIITWAGKEKTEFFDDYVLPLGKEARLVRVFYPEYYRSLSTRLYNFDGSKVTPEKTTVISYQEKVDREGKAYKQITSAEQFDNYEEAEAYLLSQESGNYRIVSDNPFVSPVPLEPLKHYQLIHSSDNSVAKPGGGMLPSVKIFKYIE